MDIKQGILGDKYFLAALAALAERPSRIYRLFLSTKESPFYFYTVRLISQGKWKQIGLDDYFPLLENTPAFSKSMDNELWFIILQKAWAKIHKNYLQIEKNTID